MKNVNAGHYTQSAGSDLKSFPLASMRPPWPGDAATESSGILSEEACWCIRQVFASSVVGAAQPIKA